MTICLLAEDSNTQRKIMRKLVESCGIEVVEADNGLHAIEYCEENLPDLIILDMNMPKMNGIEFLNALNKMPKEFNPHIIVCSADIITDDIVAAVKAGADEYHCKSMNIDSLRKKIINAPSVSSF